MAPTGSSAKARQSAPAKGRAARPIVPAIPLPYVKRQAAAKAAAATQAPAEASAPPTSSTAASPKVANVKAPVPTTETAQPIQSPSVAKVTGDEEAGLTKSEETEVTPSNESTPVENDFIDDTTSTFDSTNTSTDSPASSAPVTQGSEEKSLGSNQFAQAQSNSSESAVPTSASTVNTHTGSHPAVVTDSMAAGVLAKGNRPAPVSPFRYQMPPPFHPAQRPLQGPPGIADGDRGVRGPMHQSHMSSGSAVQFGMYNHSANSSPAPPHSGGIAPPPGMPMNDARSQYMNPPHAGAYPPMMPMSAELPPASHYDGYARSTMAHAPPETFQPYGNGFGPSTPHSVHGSQSSGHPDEPMLHNHYQAGHNRNGPNGFSQDFRPPNGQEPPAIGQDFSRMSSHHGHQHHPSVQEDNAEGLGDYIRQQFGEPTLSDFQLELRYSNNRAAPARFPGHRLVLARSPALSSFCRSQSSPQQVFIVQIENKWVRSDAYYAALQRLYGLPLLPVPPPLDRMHGGDYTAAGSAEERFDFALAYAAAGALLVWEPVVERGCRIAAQLLDWPTVEKALEFALENFVDHGTHEIYKYNDGSKILFYAVVNFVIANMPPNFSLDNTVPESTTYSRLPMNPGASPAATSEVAEVPVQINGQASQNPPSVRGHRHQLSNIQFGDLAPTDAGNAQANGHLSGRVNGVANVTNGTSGSASDTPRASQQARPIMHTVLSRILLSVPFSLLQLILDPPASMRANSWANAESRMRIVKQAVDEREVRRNRIIEAVLDGRVANSSPILEQIRSPVPRNQDGWGVLGWQEEIVFHSNGEEPSLSRRWSPLRDGHNVRVAEFP